MLPAASKTCHQHALLVRAAIKERMSVALRNRTAVGGPDAVEQAEHPAAHRAAKGWRKLPKQGRGRRWFRTCPREPVLPMTFMTIASLTGVSCVHGQQISRLAYAAPRALRLRSCTRDGTLQGEPRGRAALRTMAA